VSGCDRESRVEVDVGRFGVVRGSQVASAKAGQSRGAKLPVLNQPTHRPLPTAHCAQRGGEEPSLTNCDAHRPTSLGMAGRMERGPHREQTLNKCMSYLLATANWGRILHFVCLLCSKRKGVWSSNMPYYLVHTTDKRDCQQRDCVASGSPRMQKMIIALSTKVELPPRHNNVCSSMILPGPLKTLLANCRILQSPISLRTGKSTIMACADFIFILRAIPQLMISLSPWRPPFSSSSCN